MAYRIRVDGVTVECDSTEEAINLVRGARGNSRPDGHLEINQAPSAKSYPASPRRHIRVSNTVKEFLATLQESYPSPVASDRLAHRLGTTAKGIPAVVLGVRVLIKRWGAKFEDIVEWRKISGDNKTVRQYRLTIDGLKMLQEKMGDKVIEPKDEEKDSSLFRGMHHE